MQDSAHDGEAAAQVLRQFRQVFNAVKSHFREVERRSGLGGAQVWALSIVRDQPGIGITGLAQAMDIRQTTASNLVRSMVERDLVSVAREGADRRAVQLRVLPAGARILRKVRGPFSGVLPDALGKLRPATLRRLQRDLQELLVLLDADAAGAQVPLAEL